MPSGRGLPGSPLDLAGIVSDRVRRSCSVRPFPWGRTSPGSSFRVAAPLQSSFAFDSRPRPLGPEPPARVPCLIAASPAASTVVGRFHAPDLVPSSGFRSLSTAFSATGFAGLFHPAATSRLTDHSGASLPVQPSSLTRGSCPLAVVAGTLTDSHRSPRTTASASRPRSARSSVLDGTGVIHPAGRSPPWFHSSRLWPRTVCPSSSGPPLSTSPRRTFARALVPSGRPQRIVSARFR